MSLIKTLLIGVILFVVTDTVFAQRPVQVSSKRNDRGQINFFTQSSLPYPITVTLNFSDLQNVNIPSSGYVVRKSMKPGRATVLTLTQSTQVSGYPPKYRYTFSYRMGCLKTKHDDDISYVLPVAEGKTTTVSTFKYVGEEYGENKPKNYYGLRFSMQEGDTLFATRKGKIITVYNKGDQTTENLNYSNDQSYIRVVHEDCTFALYRVFDKDNVFVEVGDQINVGDPLALAGGENFASGMHSRLFILYPEDSPTEKTKNGKRTDQAFYWAYVKPKFILASKKTNHLVKNATYTSVHPEEVITKEMSRKERRRWKKANKSD